MKPTILFVDDDGGVLDGLRRQLRRRREVWELRFARSGEEALALLATETVDVVVTDVRMPGIDGLELLRRVRARFPAAVRIVLSGYASPADERQAYQAAHRVLPKPCEHDRLVEVLEQAVGTRVRVPERAVHTLVGGVDGLPSVPQVYTELQAVLRDEMSDAQSVARVIERDAVMVASVLRGANAAAFGLSEPVTRVRDAVAYLGRRMVTNMVLSLATFDRFREAGVSLSSMRLFQARAMATASVAMRLVERRDRDDAYVAAMLHDIGQLVMLVAFGGPYEAISGGDLAAERAAYSTTHDTVGAYLLGLWGLPSGVVEAVAAHHEPLAESHHDVSRAVRIAGALIRASQAPEGSSAEHDTWPLTATERARADAWLTDARQPSAAITSRSQVRPRSPTVTVLRPVTYRAIRRP